MFSCETRLRRCSDTSTALLHSANKEKTNNERNKTSDDKVTGSSVSTGTREFFFLKKVTLLLLNCVDCALIKKHEETTSLPNLSDLMMCQSVTYLNVFICSKLSQQPD